PSQMVPIAGGIPVALGTIWEGREPVFSWRFQTRCLPREFRQAPGICERRLSKESVFGVAQHTDLTGNRVQVVAQHADLAEGRVQVVTQNADLARGDLGVAVEG